MTSATAAPRADAHRGIRGLRRIGWFHPEWWVLLAAAAGWTLIAATLHSHAGRTGPGGSGGSGAFWLIAMVLAMMLPLVIASVRHVAFSSLWGRRHRAIFAFLTGYVALWMLVLAVIVGARDLATSFVGWTAVAAATTVAASLWEFTPGKRRRLHRCLRTVPLAPQGWRAERDCAWFGVTTGVNCVATCWALMAVCVTFSHSVPIMLTVFAIQLSGRYQRRPSPTLASLSVIGVCLAWLAASLIA